MQDESEIQQTLEAWHPAFACSVQVNMPPTWNQTQSTPYRLVFTNAEITAAETGQFYRLAHRHRFPNPRLFTPSSITLSSLYHPAFFANIEKMSLGFLPRKARPQRITQASIDTAEFWLQSLLFLAGVTLSAAIVQKRFSAGTLQSKFYRLWQAGGVAHRNGLQPLAELNLEQQVIDLATSQLSNQHQLLGLKKIYSQALGSLVKPATDLRAMPRISYDHPLQERFAFTSELRQVLGKNLSAVVVYGSSVTSANYADYDLILVVKDSDAALNCLAGTKPMHQGRELNMSVHNELDFMTYQMASGDNLTDYALCLYGEVYVPHKPLEDMRHRNFSFGYVRLRQIMGMAAYAASAPHSDANDDKTNLYNYFVKIPHNIFKGTYGVDGVLFNKNEVAARIREAFDYDLDKQIALCRSGLAGEALATAAWCTQNLLCRLNSTFNVFQESPT
jgi:hypothetical protein